MSAIAVVVTPLEAGTPVVVICRDKFVVHKIALTSNGIERVVSGRGGPRASIVTCNESI